MINIAKQNREKLFNYINNLGIHIGNYGGTNPFWRELTKTFHDAYDAQSFTHQDQILAVVEQANAMPKTNYLIKPVSADESDGQWRKLMFDMFCITYIPGCLYFYLRFNKSRGEMALAGIFLNNQKLLGQAKQYLQEVRLAPSYVNLRHFYYLEQITAYLKKLIALRGNIRILEIGAGGGALKQLIKHRFKQYIKSYSIVDLPEMLCVSCHSSIDFQPNENIQIVQENSESIDECIPNIFIPAGSSQAISNSQFTYDLFLNTHSFQEMDDGIIDSYFEIIYKKASKGALFFNTNWVQNKMTKLSGEEYNNDPKSYPYKSSDEVAFFQPDPFHDYLSKRYGYKRKTPAHTSIRWINVV